GGGASRAGASRPDGTRGGSRPSRGAARGYRRSVSAPVDWRTPVPATGHAKTAAAFVRRCRRTYRRPDFESFTWTLRCWFVGTSKARAPRRRLPARSSTNAVHVAVLH